MVNKLGEVLDIEAADSYIKRPAGPMVTIEALRYKLTIKVCPQLEWSWVKEPSRGGTECTILAHIDSGTNALSIQNKRHLHWKVLDDKQGMSNEVKFSSPTHNLLMKTEVVHLKHQENKNRSASIQALP
jgi:hypothetical protein